MSIERPIPKQPIPPHAIKVFDGVIFDVYQWEQEKYDGTKKTFEKLKRNDTVLLIPTTQQETILMTRQSQPGKSNFISFIGGSVEDNESVEDAARRELHEEGGYSCEKLDLWYSHQSASKIDYFIFVLFARNCVKVAKDQKLDSGEQIEVFEVNFNEMIDNVLDPACPHNDLKLIILQHERKGRLDALKSLILG